MKMTVSLTVSIAALTLVSRLRPQGDIRQQSDPEPSSSVQLKACTGRRSRVLVDVHWFTAHRAPSPYLRPGRDGAGLFFRLEQQRLQIKARFRQGRVGLRCRPTIRVFVPEGTVWQCHAGLSSLAHDARDGRSLVESRRASVRVSPSPSRLRPRRDVMATRRWALLFST